jgi:hypothetical protein
MSRNDAVDLAQRLYSRLPANYRAYDAEEPQDYAMLALLRVIGEQAANLRLDLDDLWDDFFIETASDWVVPYLGALVGTRLLPDPVEQGDRLEVANTVRWRRTRGTPAMLRSLARSVTGWPDDLAEYFQHLGWSQNVNHPRRFDPLSPDVRDPTVLGRLGRADDSASHAADFRLSAALDAPRLDRTSLGVGRAAWGTPGRYDIKNLGFLFRRLLTFKLEGVTPAADDPRLPQPVDPTCFTFDPLHHETPLFVEAMRQPLTRSEFERAPWATFGSDVAVRQVGVLLASDAKPAPATSQSEVPFSFGGRGAGLRLDALDGLRLLDTRPFDRGEPHFVIEAFWLEEGGGVVPLGSLSTLLAATGGVSAFGAHETATGPGRLALRVVTGRPIVAPSNPPVTVATSSAGGRFPGTVVAVQAIPDARPRTADALYVYLPPQFLGPADAPVDTPFQPIGRGVFHVAVDGTTYSQADMKAETLARPSEGQVYPPRPTTASTVPANEFVRIARRSGRLSPSDRIDSRPSGAYLLDDGRFAAARAIYRLELFTGTFQALGAIATVERDQSAHPDLEFSMGGPRWPSFSYAPRRFAAGDDPEAGLLAVHVSVVDGGDSVPATELVIVNRAGDSLLVYLPELEGIDADGVRMFIGADGSSHCAPASDDALAAVQAAGSLAGLPTARPSAGQALPIPGRRPLEQRRPVAIELCGGRCRTRLLPGELGIDPERGTFAFAAGDPSIGGGRLSVDYVEAFSDRIGARTFTRDLDGSVPTRIVAQLGDAPVVARERVHTTLEDAFTHSGENGTLEEVIEIADSATYVLDRELVFDRMAGGRLTVRAANGERPCIVLRASLPASSPASPPSSPPASPPVPPGGPILLFSSRLERLELGGLLISGGAVHVATSIKAALFSACTLDPRTAAAASLIVTDDDRNSQSAYLICRSVTGGLTMGDGIEQLTIADSIIDRFGALAIGGLPVVAPPASPPSSPPASPPSSPPASPRDADMLVPARPALRDGARDVLAFLRSTGPAIGVTRGGEMVRIATRLEAADVGLTESPVRRLHLERVTVLGRIRCEVLEASECLLDDIARVEDQQAGCIRFSRYELGSALPRRYQCVPSDEQSGAWSSRARCEAPLFGSRAYGWPNYVQLAARTPDSIRNASERRSEVGAFTGRLDTLRRRNFEMKTREFLPVGLSALALAET